MSSNEVLEEILITRNKFLEEIRNCLDIPAFAFLGDVAV